MFGVPLPLTRPVALVLRGVRRFAYQRLEFDHLGMAMDGTAVPDRLSGMKTGETAAIVSIASSQASAKRLADMGFVRGALVEMIRPGRPCLVRIGSTCVGLGADHQRSIGVKRTQV